MENSEIHDLINKAEKIECAGRTATESELKVVTDSYRIAYAEIKNRILATSVTNKVADAAMYYGYEHGHSAGQGESLRIALTLCNDVFEAERNR